MSKNMTSVLPKLTNEEREFLCRVMELSHQQLALTPKATVMQKVREDYKRTSVYNKLFPVWKRALLVWLWFIGLTILLLVGLFMLAALIAAFVFLAGKTVFAWLLLIPIGSAIATFIVWSLGDL